MTVYTYADNGRISDFTMTNGGSGFAPGDILSNGLFVVDTVSTSTAITGFDNATSAIEVAGDVTADYPADAVFRSYGTTTNDRQAYVISSVFDSGTTTITVGASIADEAPAGFITRGIVLTLHLGWPNQTGRVGNDSGANPSDPESGQFDVVSVDDKTLTLAKVGDARALFDSFPTVVVNAGEALPSGFYTVDSTSYADGATSVTLVEDLTAPLPEHYQTRIYPVPTYPYVSGPGTSMDFTITEIVPGDGTLRIIVDYIVVDIS